MTLANFVDLKVYKTGAPPAPGTAAVRKQVWTDTKAIDRDNHTVSFIISTAREDREGDTIALEGWQLANFRKNPVVLWAHDHWSPPVATAINIYTEEDALKATAKFTTRDVYPFGYMIFQMYAEGFLKATSVGFMPLEWKYREGGEGKRRGIDFIKQELLEFSTVSVPANPDAIVAARGKGIDLTPLKQWAEEALDTWDEHEGLSIPKHRVETLRSLVTNPNYVLGPDQQDALLQENIKRAKEQTTEEFVLEVDEKAKDEEDIEFIIDASAPAGQPFTLGDVKAYIDAMNATLVKDIEERISNMFVSTSTNLEQAIASGAASSKADLLVTVDKHLVAFEAEQSAALLRAVETIQSKLADMATNIAGQHALQEGRLASQLQDKLTSLIEEKLIEQIELINRDHARATQSKIGRAEDRFAQVEQRVAESLHTQGMEMKTLILAKLAELDSVIVETVKGCVTEQLAEIKLLLVRLASKQEHFIDTHKLTDREAVQRAVERIGDEVNDVLRAFEEIVADLPKRETVLELDEKAQEPAPSAVKEPVDDEEDLDVQEDEIRSLVHSKLRTSVDGLVARGVRQVNGKLD